MPSARSTLALVAALAYGASVLAMPMQNSYDLVERDYDDLAELDARMYDTDVEEYYARDVTTSAVAAAASTTVPAVPTNSGVSTHHHKGSHRHSHGHKQLHKHLQNNHKAHGKKGAVAPTTTGSLFAPTPSPDAANSKLVAREPRGGKGGKGRGGKRGGHGGKGRKHGGKGHRGGKGGKRAKAAAEASAEPAGGEAPAAEPIAARGLFSRKHKKTADEKASVTSETASKTEEKELDAPSASSSATPSTRKHKHKHSKKAGKRHGLHRLSRHRLGKHSKKATPTSSLATSATPSATA